MPKTTNKLSPLKEVYCINCHVELLPTLAERRGEEDLLCPDCNTSFSIEEAEQFLKKLSPTEEGLCPACDATLAFDIEDRSTNGKIQCPICGDSFYITEVSEIEHQQRRTTTQGRTLSKPEIMLKNFKIYVILSIFLDFLFLFTILAFSESRRIEESYYLLNEEQKINHNTWKTVLSLFLIIKIITFLLGFLGYLSQ